MTLTPLMKKRLLSFLEDDAAGNDVTTALIPARKCVAAIKCNEECVLAGVEEAEWLFRQAGLKARILRKDGEKIKKPCTVMQVTGLNKRILPIERTALNVLTRMSGVATACQKAGKIAKVAVTRKTSPGFQLFDKKAAALGGAWPHRPDLSRMILFKDNHLKFIPITEAVRKAKKTGEIVEVEAETLSQALEAVKAGADIVMLDNFPVKQAKEAVKRIRKANPQAVIELSGGITSSNLRKFASLGADFISLGELTKSVKGIDFSLDVVKLA